uniref:Glial cells missing transcription factor 1 n=1 Tax=Falco tinnunculus TaxID=100819 RepID=A0A8C4UMY9_FALTI
MLKGADDVVMEQEDSASQHGEITSWDINDIKLPQDVRQIDWFQEWPDSYIKRIYSSEDKNAQKHHSSWAMRNTNNHNSRILKKSCLGVVVCGNDCSTLDGRKIYLRPAICDKARQKQQREPCVVLACATNSAPLRLITRLFLTYHNLFQKSKGAHDHPRPETKIEAEARRSVQKAQTAFSPSYPRLKRIQETEVTFITGAMPTQKALPLLPSKPDAYMLPANFRGYLSKSSREPMLDSCCGRPPYPGAAGEDGGSGEASTWSRSPHVLPMTKSSHHPFRPSAGPLGDESCEETPPLAHSSSGLPLPPYPAPQGSPCPRASGAPHHRPFWAPARGSGGEGGEGGCCMGLSHCNDDTAFNLYPLW